MVAFPPALELASEPAPEVELVPAPESSSAEAAEAVELGDEDESELLEALDEPMPAANVLVVPAEGVAAALSDEGESDDVFPESDEPSVAGEVEFDEGAEASFFAAEVRFLSVDVVLFAIDDVDAEEVELPELVPFVLEPDSSANEKLVLDFLVEALSALPPLTWVWLVPLVLASARPSGLVPVCPTFSAYCPFTFPGGSYRQTQKFEGAFEKIVSSGQYARPHAILLVDFHTT